jgi:hypothetical protein
MAINSIQSGYNLINQSSQMAKKAADDINAKTSDTTQTDYNSQSSLSGTASNPTNTTDANSAEKQKTVEQSQKSSADNIDPLVKLNQAVQYNNVGTNIVQKNQELIGSMLDVRA